MSEGIAPIGILRRPPGSFRRCLTTIDDKFTVFSTESYFREAWDGALAEFGSGAEALVQRLALVTFKPESIVGRRVGRCLDFLLEHGFVAIAHRRFRYTRRSMREIWRYQWNVATLERLALSDVMNTATESLFVVLQDVQEPLEVPATVRLRGLKGSALPWLRKPDQLRSVLGGGNRMMTFVHCSDEPIDVIREIGICFGRREQRALLREIRGGIFRDRRAEVLDAAEALYEETPAHSLDLDEALASLEATLREAERRRPERAEQVEAVRTRLRLAESGEPLAWRQFEEDLASLGVEAPLWDCVVLGSQFVQHDVENEVCTIDDDGRPEWLRGEGRLCPLPPGPWEDGD